MQTKHLSALIGLIVTPPPFLVIGSCADYKLHGSLGGPARIILPPTKPQEWAPSQLPHRSASDLRGQRSRGPP